jgi:sugar lactone lactonase YvrE
MQDARGTRIVADGLGFTNEALVDPSGAYLYVNETYTRRFSRFPLKKNGDLGRKEVVVEFARGQFPDGFAFDSDNGAWITSIVSNQLIRVDLATGAAETVLEDADTGYVDWFEEAFRMRCLDRPFIDTVQSQRLKHVSSIAFGGKALKTAYLGNLLDTSIYQVDLPNSGHAPVHWHYPLL